MNKLKIILLYCSLFVYAPQASAQANEMPPLLVMVYGDELTSNPNLQRGQSFHSQLEKKLKGIGFQVKVQHVGENDITSKKAAERLPYLIGKAPDIVILQLGRTDIERGLNPVAFKQNMTRIIRALKKKNIFVIIMGTKSPATNGVAYAKKIKNAFQKVSKKISFYPDTLHNITGRPELTIGDGRQPNASGVGVMVDGVYRMVDSGLRWRLKVISQIRAQQQMQMR